MTTRFGHAANFPISILQAFGAVVAQPSSMTSRNNEPTVRAIIAAARSAPTATRARGAWLLAGLSGLLLWASFPPLDWGPLGWIALVPLLLLVRPAQRPRGTIVATFVCGYVTQAVMLQWLRYGDPSMYLALVALALYIALYFPVFVLACRAAVHRFRVPLVIAAPALWVGLEFLRAHLLTGFSWYYLGHTQYRWIELIQISDLVGAYGVSFVVMASSAALAVVLPRSILKRLQVEPAAPDQAAEAAAVVSRRSAIFALGLSLGLVIATLAYGYVRRGQAAFTVGPRIALVQGNFTTKVKHDPAEGMSIFTRHYVMTGDAVKFQPDAIVWPETMFREPLLIKSPGLSEKDLFRVAPFFPSYAWNSTHVPDLLHNLSRQANAELIIGIDTFVAEHDSLKHFNSAVLSEPATGIVGRYDKIHRVAFGEYIPLPNVLPFLKNFVPYGQGFGIDPGTEPVAFQCKKWRLAPLICFEDTVPHLVRGIVSQLDYRDIGGKPIDCLVNLTNDGWFDGSSGLDQHLICALFRCVECRKPMVRAVNTGISAVINGDGAVIEPEVFIDAENKGRNTMRDPKTGRWYRQLNEVLVDSVPLDNRTSLYVRYGDWFAECCGSALLLVVVLSLVPPSWFSRRTPAG